MLNEPKCLRPRPRTEPCGGGRGRGRGQIYEAKAEAEAESKIKETDMNNVLLEYSTSWFNRRDWA